MKQRFITYLTVSLVLLAFGFIITPNAEFDQPYSNIIYDRGGQLLGGKIASDAQWRFPVIDSIPENFKMALLSFEDKRFYNHCGVDVLSLSRAVVQNLKAQRVVSGASTLTMQVCRMSRGNKPRTVPQKLIEMAMALKLDLSKSKDEILKQHCSHAPFGGNVVGLEAASWRYYSKAPEQLSLAEAAMLAVLPNAPALIHPGRNRSALKAKRNKLLKTLWAENKIDDIDYELAILEPIPDQPIPLPRLAPHLLEYVSLKNKDVSKTTTTVDSKIQQLALNTAEVFSLEYQESDIQNLGILILDTKSGEVLSYIGNSPQTKDQSFVDMIQAGRSSGSVLKPILYAAALDDGLISPHGLVKDVPMQYNGYRAQNYNKEFLGAIKADEALARSLNVPAVELLSRYDVSRFKTKLQKLGHTTINKSAGHYGLSLILGGADISLWDLTGSYASMGRILLRYKNDQSRYSPTDVHEATYQVQTPAVSNYQYEPTHFSAASIHHSFEAMKKVSRPNAEGEWESFSSTKEIAWKTGTSYGHRDAWAIGVSPEYTIGVWVGNADGEGKHSLVGVKRAAPILFDLINKLQISSFPVPYDDLQQLAICNHSGYLASKYCTKVDTLFQIESSSGKTCPYHLQISVDQEGKRVNGNCASPSQMQMKNYFNLPADVAYYYRLHHPEYKNLPEYRTDCEDENEDDKMRFIYPKRKSQIYLPKNGEGEQEAAIFHVAHHKSETKLYWHMDEEYLGMTKDNHTMPILAETGEHLLVLVDEDGHSINRSFTILGE